MFKNIGVVFAFATSVSLFGTPLAAQGSLTLPNLVPTVAARSVGQHCGDIGVLTATNGGFMSATSVSDTNLAFNEQFCLARTFAISQSGQIVNALVGLSEAEIAQSCTGISGFMAGKMPELVVKQPALMQENLLAVALGSGQTKEQLTSGGKICLGVGYRTDDSKMALASAMLLVGAGHVAYSEIIGHHLREGFGVGADTAAGQHWIEFSTAKLEQGAAAAILPEQSNERVAVLRAALKLAGPVISVKPKPRDDNKLFRLTSLAPVTGDALAEEQSWLSAQRENTLDGYYSHLAKHPKGPHAQSARQKLREMGVSTAGISKLLQGELNQNNCKIRPNHVRNFRPDGQFGKRSLAALRLYNTMKPVDCSALVELDPRRSQRGKGSWISDAQDNVVTLKQCQHKNACGDYGDDWDVDYQNGCLYKRKGKAAAGKFAVWDGECTSGLISGRGTLKLSNGRKLAGNYAAGELLPCAGGLVYNSRGECVKKALVPKLPKYRSLLVKNSCHQTLDIRLVYKTTAGGRNVLLRIGAGRSRSAGGGKVTSRSVKYRAKSVGGKVWNNSFGYRNFSPTSNGKYYYLNLSC